MNYNYVCALVYPRLQAFSLRIVQLKLTGQELAV